MVHSRNKGHTRERKIRHRWIAAGWPDAKRGDQSRAGHEESDVVVGERTVWIPSEVIAERGVGHTIPGFRCEVKDQKSLPGKRVMAAYDQATRAATADQIPVAIFHVARRGDYALLDLGHLMQLASCGTADVATGSTGDLEPANDGGEREDVI